MKTTSPQVSNTKGPGTRAPSTRGVPTPNFPGFAGKTEKRVAKLQNPAPQARVSHNAHPENAECLRTQCVFDVTKHFSKRHGKKPISNPYLRKLRMLTRHHRTQKGDPALLWLSFCRLHTKFSAEHNKSTAIFYGLKALCSWLCFCCASDSKGWLCACYLRFGHARKSQEVTTHGRAAQPYHWRGADRCWRAVAHRHRSLKSVFLRGLKSELLLPDLGSLAPIPHSSSSELLL